MVGHCQSGKVAWMGPFPHARAMSQVMLYSAARSALGGVKVALYQQSKSMSKPHSSRITHLLEIWEQTGKTPARVTKFFPVVIIVGGTAIE